MGWRLLFFPFVTDSAAVRCRDALTGQLLVLMELNLFRAKAPRWSAIP